jgi:transcriptional regulator with XRE-family HTH domain
MTTHKVPNTDFAHRLKLLRDANRLTQYRLAKLSGLTPSTICKLESNERQPTWRVVIALAGVLNCTPNDFLGDEDLKRLTRARAGGDQDGQPAPKQTKSKKS